MNKRRNVRLVIYLLLLVIFMFAAWLRSRKQPLIAPRNTNEVRVVSKEKNVFDRSIARIEFTKHAKCRMECRQITAEEVKDIMENGAVNFQKSDTRAKPCPEWALEGFTKQDDQHVRIIFAQCDKKTKVVTCIDLDKDFVCTCN